MFGYLSSLRMTLSVFPAKHASHVFPILLIALGLLGIFGSLEIFFKSRQLALNAIILRHLMGRKTSRRSVTVFLQCFLIGNCKNVF